MRRFIFTERGGIYIIDLQQTLQLLEEAHAFARNVAERGGSILFVGTKKQSQGAVEEQAKRVNMPYVNHRWLGGLLTNWRTISDRIDRLKEQLAVREARRLGLPVVALVDTNCDPDEADYVVPGNDDAIRSCDLVVRVIADGIAAGQQKATPADFTPAKNGASTEEQTAPGPEGDDEQVSPEEDPVAEAAPAAEETKPEEVPAE
jgi:small subunit ribosomal protein S2